MKPIIADSKRVAACGLYCGACRSFRRGKCPGCAANDRAGWCKIRSCCKEQGRASCADCAEFPDPRSCARFDNFVSRVIGLLLRSDRSACIAAIRKYGYDRFALEMAERRRQSLRRGTTL